MSSDDSEDDGSRGEGPCVIAVDSSSSGEDRGACGSDGDTSLESDSTSSITNEESSVEDSDLEETTLPSKRKAPAAEVGGSKRPKTPATTKFRQKLLSNYEWADARTIKKVKLQLRINCRLCSRQMRFDNTSMLNHERNSQKHLQLVAFAQGQQPVSDFFADNDAWMHVLERALHIGLSHQQIRRLFAPSMLARIKRVESPATQHLLQRDLKLLKSSLRVQLCQRIDLCTLPFGLMFDESNTKTGHGVTTVTLTNMEGQWMIEVAFLPDGKAETYTKLLLNTVASCGLQTDLLVAVSSDNCAAAFKAAKDTSKKSELALPVECGAHGLQLILTHFCKPLKKGATAVVEAVSNALFGGGHLAKRRGRLRKILTTVSISKLRFVATRWGSKVRAAYLIVAHRTELLEFLQAELAIARSPARTLEDSAKKARTRLERCVSLLQDEDVLIETHVMASLHKLSDVLRSLQGHKRNTCSPRHLGKLLQTVATWRELVAFKEPLSFDPTLYGVPTSVVASLSPSKIARLRRLLRTGAAKAIAEYDKLMSRTADLIAAINLFHPAYLRDMETIRTREELARLLGSPGSGSPPRARLLGRITIDDLWGEFTLYQRSVDAQPREELLFGAAYWGRGGDAVHRFPSLATLARRYLAIRPSIALAESGFSHMNLVDRSTRGSLNRDALAAELLIRVNGPRQDWLGRLQTTANPEVKKRRRQDVYTTPA